MKMARNNLDIGMQITDAILNEFEKNGKCAIPLDEHKYSFPLQDRIQIELEKIANKDKVYNKYEKKEKTNGYKN